MTPSHQPRLFGPKTFGMAVAALGLYGAPAAAGETHQQPVASISTSVASIAGADRASDTSPHRLSQAELADARGGETVVLNDQDLIAVTANNAIGSYVAGTINLSDNALSSFNGVGNFLFNTGAQNSLQTGMTLTITIEN